MLKAEPEDLSCLGQSPQDLGCFGRSPKDLSCFGQSPETCAELLLREVGTRASLDDPMDLIRCQKLPGKAQWHTVQTSTN